MEQHSQKTNDQLLIESANTGDFHEVSRLLSEGANPKFTQSMALRCAALKGFHEIVGILAPVSETRGQQSWPLRAAAMGGHNKCVEILIPLSSPKDLDSAALYHAAKFGHLECAKQLIPVSDIRSERIGEQLGKIIPMFYDNGDRDIIKHLAWNMSVDDLRQAMDDMEEKGDAYSGAVSLIQSEILKSLHPDASNSPSKNKRRASP